ncbi:GntR family transcriptional regulator [Brucella sp. NM4]|uniref:GntR family transcriptional regulator n=1 Tax=Brucella/Ochrobactrum group TaxID=2826938 RepID=UPI0024BBFD20|nr:GntR family transcriptional regulator [Brucella sp. NM4]WHS30360.1 GntR family transcriptional regulator [Brucella sp. NM4]WHT45298.1 GntR family transcriptional regulator [Ochrobactrum sp. SSR]
MHSKPRSSLGARVTDRLRRAIIDGELELGDALSEDKLATALGVSRSPVKEAFAILEQQGLIDVQPQRGTFVFLPTHEDTVNLCEFRKTIEVEAVRLAMVRRRDETLNAMRIAAKDMVEACEAGDVLRGARADDHFHDAALENCGNPYLVNAYHLVASKVAALRSHRSSLPTRKFSSAEHLVIVDLLENNQIAQALQQLSAHIMMMAERYGIDNEPVRALGTRAARGARLDHIGPLTD